MATSDDGGTYYGDQDATQPEDSDDWNKGAAEIRKVKEQRAAQWPNFVGKACTPTEDEINYVDGVTSAIQTQLDAKVATTTYTATDVLNKVLTVDVNDSGINATTINGVTEPEIAKLANADFTVLSKGGAAVLTAADAPVRDFVFSASATNASGSASYADLGSITLPAVTSGSSVWIQVVATIQVSSPVDIYLMITDSSNTSIMAGNEAVRAAGNATYSEFFVMTAMAVSASPGSGSLTFKVRHYGSGTGYTILNHAITAIEFA